MRNRFVLMAAAGLATSGAAFAGDCPGDCNGDGMASVLDFVCFQGEWQNQTDAGDCNGDGMYSILDFVCFQGEWQDFAQNGCGGGDVALDDDFDDYALGDACGQGPWEPWDLNNDACAVVSDEQASSGTQSLKIDGTQGIIGDDMVVVFDGICEGQWTFEAQTYVPADQGPVSTYALLLNTYEHAGTKNWSTQVRFDSGLGIVESEADGGVANLVTDQWVPLRVEIDLDADTQDIYYNDELLVSKSWSEGLSGGGQTCIEAIDLYGNEPGLGGIIYFDDVRVTQN